MKHTLKVFWTFSALTVLALFYQNCGKGFEAQEVIQLGSNSPIPPENILNGSEKGNPFTCKAVEEQSKTPLRRLTQKQYSNTLLTALGPTLHDKIKSSISTLYPDILMKGVQDLQVQIEDTQMSAYQSIAEKAYSTIQATPAIATQLAGTCLSATAVTADCKKNFVNNLGKKMFRRPLTTTETTKFVSQVFDKGANANEGVALTVYTLMISPDFLLRVELGNPDDSTTIGTFNLSPYEVASRLSYYLWDAPPDEPLMSAADKSQLSTNAEISLQVDRMLADPRAREKIKDFFRFWLDPTSYPTSAYTADFLNGVDATAVNTEFEREMFEYIDYIVFKKNGTFEDLLSSSDSFARTPAAAQIYGHEPVTGMTPAQTNSVRKGLLMRVPVIATEGNETHPILRGVKFRQRFLCDPLGLPSGVMTSDPTFFSDEARMKASTRTRTAGLTSGQSCMLCHASINPLGFALENFDGLGRHRTIEKSYSTMGKFLAEFPVDTRVNDLTIDDRTAYGVNDATEVIDRMLDGNKASACFVRQVYRYYQVKNDTAQDGCQLASMYEKIKSKDYAGKPILSVFKELLVYPAIFKRSL